MCQWCDKMCADGRGYVLNKEEYEKLIDKMNSKVKLTTVLSQSKNSTPQKPLLKKRLACSSFRSVSKKDYSKVA